GDGSGRVVGVGDGRGGGPRLGVRHGDGGRARGAGVHGDGGVPGDVQPGLDHPVDPALERPGVLHGPGVQQVGALGHAHGGGAAGVDGDLVPAALALAGVPGEVGEVLGGGPAVGADVPDGHVVGLGL